MAYKVIDVSKWFIQNNKDIAVPSRDGHFKLQKLLYYSQAMNLAVKDTVLFNNKIEAWANGPVVSEVYMQYRHNNLVENTFDKEEFDYSNVFDETTLRILEIVNYVYGMQTAEQLIELTHSEEPWKKLKEKALLGLNPEITVESMKKYYSSLKEIFELYKDYDFSQEVSVFINGNVFVYNKNETVLTDEDIRLLSSIGDDHTGEKYFVYKDNDGELVVY